MEFILMENELKEQLKIRYIYPFKNNWYHTILLIVYLLILYFFNYIITDQLKIDINSSNIFTMLYILFWYLILLYISFPILADLDFYYNYYKNINILLKMDFMIKNNMDLEYTHFQTDFDLLRKQIKRRVIHSNRNFLTHDYELKRIVQTIDTFFDTSIKLILKNKIKVTNFNFSNIENFMESLGETFIKKPAHFDIISTKYFFKEWNLQLQYINNEIFEETKNDVEKYYAGTKLKRTIIPTINLSSNILTIIFLVLSIT